MLTRPSTQLSLFVALPVRSFAAAEHPVQWIWRMRDDHTANKTACKRADNIENALISQTPLQLMFGGFTLADPVVRSNANFVRLLAQEHSIPSLLKMQIGR